MSNENSTKIKTYTNKSTYWENKHSSHAHNRRQNMEQCLELDPKPKPN